MLLQSFLDGYGDNLGIGVRFPWDLVIEVILAMKFSQSISLVTL